MKQIEWNIRKIWLSAQVQERFVSTKCITDENGRNWVGSNLFVDSFDKGFSYIFSYIYTI